MGSGRFVMLVALASACSSAPLRGQRLEVTSGIGSIDALTVTVVGARATLVDDQRVDDGGATLGFPLTLAIDGQGRHEPVRILVWGLAGGADVAYGSIPVVLDPASDEVFPVRLVTPPADCDGDRIPDVDDRCPSVADRGQLDGDGNGIDDVCEPGKQCDGNLLDNGDFEADLAGWNRSLTASQRLQAGGHTGAQSDRLCKRPDAGATTYDSENNDVVINLVAGDAYRVDAWVRSSTAPSQDVRVEMRDYTSAGVLLAATPSPILHPTDAWQVLTATSTVVAGANELGIDVGSLDAVDNTCIDVDTICVVKVAVCP